VILHAGLKDLFFVIAIGLLKPPGMLLHAFHVLFEFKMAWV
jgi:hypothetical protein